MTPTIGELLERAEQLYRDNSLGAVRAWKDRTAGLAVGYLPLYVPRELLWAQGVLPVGLMGGGEDLEIIRGDAFYQSYICHLPRSTIELGLNGSLDCLDGVLFPATCDVIRNLSGMWKMTFPDKFVHYLDMPQNFDPEIGGSFYRAELEHIAHELVARGAYEPTPERLRAAIEQYDANRKEIDALYELRRAEPWRVPTHELYLLLRAGLVLPPDEHTEMLVRYGEAVRTDDERQPMDLARVVVAGAFCEQPPLGLIKTIERAGCYVVDDDFVPVHRAIVGSIDPGDDPLGAIVDAFLAQGRPCAVRYAERDVKGKDLVDKAERAGAEGVVFCAPSFCDPALLDQPMAVRALDTASVPWTAFKYAENSGQFQVIREQAGTFADSIKLWSEV